MRYQSLRDFLESLERLGQLKRVAFPLDPHLEITEVCDRVLKQQGPALLFTHPKRSSIPLLANLFGTVERVALAMGRRSLEDLRELGAFLAFFKEPSPPKGWKNLWEQWPLYKQILNMPPQTVAPSYASCFTQVFEKSKVDLYQLPIQTCWPKDVAPLITWGLVITEDPLTHRYNLGVYRQQVLSRNKVIMRWLAHRGGALDYQKWRRQNPSTPFPIAIVIGADPATLLAAAMPIPDPLSEYAFAGLLRGHKTVLTTCHHHPLKIPAHAEIVLEGFLYPDEVAEEGPFGDHTGYYNEVETFPVMTVERLSMQANPIYHSTYTGKPPDEPSVLGVAFNEIFLPLIQKQFPEIVDFYLPPEGCSYRVALVAIKKEYPGHAKRIMFGVWSMLKQFLYTKWVIVTDADIPIRRWEEVVWALSTRVDPKRDILLIENTPIDYLDFASPYPGLGSKIGIDATQKYPGETHRTWGDPILSCPQIKAHIDTIWEQLGIFS